MTDLKALPDEETIAKAVALEVLDAKGEKVKFGSIIEGQKTVVVFVRALLSLRVNSELVEIWMCRALLLRCTMLLLSSTQRLSYSPSLLPLVDQACQAYVEQLVSVPQDSLTQAGTKLVIVGCGEAAAIPPYAETTKFTGPIYARPLTRALPRARNDDREPPTHAGGEERPSYLRGMSLLWNVLRSTWRGPVKNPTLIGKQGNISQLGGEFIFGPGNTCSFASRMKHTEDHIEVTDLMKEAGVLLP
ncbi:hypothetical protein NLJ89_g6590 [Agrocybe chaxingu]|uniref:Uncharacterized protein n=1 Tax=Agrocybe chaxingu TaxID=84603 RepID=A0A9W8MW92_9AGAR|nr:hypothetical protein NLJ89_g6590 [Agrocybe chaxingu]